jgi:hypothetical protein
VIGHELPNALVVAVGKIDASRGVDGDAARIGDLGVHGREAIAVAALEAGAGDGADDAGAGIDTANSKVLRVGNVNVAGAIQRDPGDRPYDGRWSGLWRTDASILAWLEAL